MFIEQVEHVTQVTALLCCVQPAVTFSLLLSPHCLFLLCAKREHRKTLVFVHFVSSGGFQFSSNLLCVTGQNSSFKKVAYLGKRLGGESQ